MGTHASPSGSASVDLAHLRPGRGRMGHATHGTSSESDGERAPFPPAVQEATDARFTFSIVGDEADQCRWRKVDILDSLDREPVQIMDFWFFSTMPHLAKWPTRGGENTPIAGRGSAHMHRDQGAKGRENPRITCGIPFASRRSVTKNWASATLRNYISSIVGWIIPRRIQ